MLAERETVVPQGAKTISETDLEELTAEVYLRNVWFGIPGERPNFIFPDAQARENYAARQEGRKPVYVDLQIALNPNWPLPPLC